MTIVLLLCVFILDNALLCFTSETCDANQRDCDSEKSAASKYSEGNVF